MDRTTRPLRSALTTAALALGLLLTGCAGVYRVDNQVQSFPGWAQGGAQAVPVAPQRYRFERLPSQRAGTAAGAQDDLEALARTALARAGWTPAEADTHAPWTVQVSASTLQRPRAPWEEPWGGLGTGIGVHLGHPGWGGSLFLRSDMPYYEREVSLVIREVASGQVVYETRARHDGRWASSPPLWGAMLDAALRDFPQPPAGPREILIDLPR